MVTCLPIALRAQDTTGAYPWRVSYFPYLTASPNDGVMLLGRAVLFRQSRWDDRVSLHDAVALEGGYSTKDAWLIRVRGDFPRLGEGWRLQASLQAGKEPEYFTNYGVAQQATRQFAAVELTRRIDGPLFVAVRGEGSHVRQRFPALDASGTTIGMLETSATDVGGRLALVIDQRDREYDTRSGVLVQGGVFVGSTTNDSYTSHSGVYALASGWLSLSEKARMTVRAGLRIGNHLSGDAARVIPAWEDDLLVVGGPESNRALPVAAQVNNCTKLASAEIRRDLVAFPGGVFGVLAFVDGGQADDCGRDVDEGMPFDRYVQGLEQRGILIHDR